MFKQQTTENKGKKERVRGKIKRHYLYFCFIRNIKIENIKTK